MKIKVDRSKKLQNYIDPTRWQNSTLRYSPPMDFPTHMAKEIGRAAIMRVLITLDEYWDYRTNEFYPDYDIGVARYPIDALHYPYDWKKIVPAPSGTRFKAYLTSHAQAADELLLNVRRLEREVSDGVITFEEYESIFERAVEYCKELAPNIRYIECCNEVDMRSFGQLTADEYVNIYLCAHRAIKRLNEKHNYKLPLELGGFSAAHPITVWDMMRDVVAGLKSAGVEMDFYSYHHYDTVEAENLVEKKNYSVARLSGVNKLRHILKLHNEMLADYGLPKRKVFLNELGRATHTGIDGDSLYNAAGVITYLLALGCESDPELYPFPWCTFHNPKLQISYTQFLLRDDGSYAMTPNGIAIKMLHSISGTRLGVNVSECSARDLEYCSVAAEDENEIFVLAVNPSGEPDIGELEISGMTEGEYVIKSYLCDATHNNCVTCSACDGKALEQTGEAICNVGADGILVHIFSLDHYAFVLYRIKKV